jgi:hypothetical protein
MYRVFLYFAFSLFSGDVDKLFFRLNDARYVHVAAHRIPCDKNVLNWTKDAPKDCDENLLTCCFVFDLPLTVFLNFPASLLLTKHMYIESVTPHS